MAVGIRLKFSGGTEDQYRAVHSKMGIDDDPPEGLILHSAGPIDEGWGVIDFWESRDHFNRFAESKLQPTLGELGDQTFQGPPDLKEFPVAHITRGRG